MRSERHGPWDYDRTRRGRAYRRAVRWWIDVPLALGGLALVVSAALLARGGVGTASAWADVVLSALLMPFLLLGLFGLVIVAGMVYLAARVLRWLPGRSEPIASRLFRVSVMARRASQRVGAVVIAPAAVGAGWGAALRDLRRQD